MVYKSQLVGIGGYYKPRHCEPRQRIAVIVPYRWVANYSKLVTDHPKPMLGADA